jgi:3-mercaptopyruvate sulfurtransferase SseA/sterol desaturase/sphingolipid hydroxylase (fatty acid hydroxylase superfamily)
MRDALRLWAYPVALAVLSLAVATTEALVPARHDQRRWRRNLGWDFFYLVFNGHLLGVIVFALASRWVLPLFDGALARVGVVDKLYRNVAAVWPLWVQIPVALLAIDLLQWMVHVLLHRVPFLWEVHKTHHSVVDGEMDWIVSFRFHWLELVVYHSLLYLPLAFFGFAPAAILVHAIFGTLIGHLNHANLDFGPRWWRYLFNSPQMHIWHHDYAATGRTTVNFGIIFSVWDWLFGTAKMPGHPPARLGFPGSENLPRDFFGQEAWPLSRLLAGHPLSSSLLGALILAVLWQLGRVPHSSGRTPMLGEHVAASQPSDDHHVYATSSEQATRALGHFGEDARAAGWAHPDEIVSVRELAFALGSPRLRLIDVRAKAGFETGHIPSAQRMVRSDYSSETPISGLSKNAADLEQALRARGVAHDSVLVIYGDGGPEPYRLFWTLRAVGGYTARILDGGLVAWKRDGRGIADGTPPALPPGDVVLPPPASAPQLLWRDLEAWVHRPGAVLLDARSAREFDGSVKHPDAARAGAIPGAVNLEWLAFLRSVDDSRLRSPAELRALVGKLGIDGQAPVVTYCQTGTRSALVWFALRQLGIPDEKLINYNGSWSEYSRLSQR